MIKRILLPIDPSPYSECAANFAISLAKIYNAEVTGLVILDLPGIESKIGPLPPGVGFFAKELENSKIDAAKVHVKNLLSKYKRIFEDAGVVFKESNAQGSPSQMIVEFSKYYDIVVLGLRNQYKFETTSELENTIDDVMDYSVTPIIAVPDSMSKFCASDKKTFKVIIAYNGSIASTRAMQRFAQMEFPKEIEATVYISNEDIEKAEDLFLNASEFLKAHGIEKIHKWITKENKIDYFDNQHLEETDIIVLGSHSSMGIFDFLVGSLARHLINENKTMLFTSQ
jgi:nucleotide-binding universal stress UspA family protein